MIGLLQTCRSRFIFSLTGAAIALIIIMSELAFNNKYKGYLKISRQA